jgi:putative restriction endonuclease
MPKQSQKKQSITTFFRDELGANFRNARWSWGAREPLGNRIYLRVWVDQIERSDGTDWVLVLHDSWKGGSPGMRERREHLADLEAGLHGYGVVCTANSEESLKTRTIKSYDRVMLLQLGRLRRAPDSIYAEIIGRQPVTPLRQRPSSASTLANDMEGLFSKRMPEKTVRQALIDARVGQGLFREHVLSLWEQRCAVTGSRTLNAITASHIKPWRECRTNEERLDGHNGLPLIANLDRLFDHGLISFQEDGRMLISNSLSADERELLGLDYPGLRIPLRPATLPFLAFHRHQCFIG